MPALPREAQVFVSFAALLRRHGFFNSIEQTVTFLKAIELLGPVSMESVRRAANATFGPSAERRPEFDALFRAYFYGDHVAATDVTDDEDLPIHDSSVSRDARISDGSAAESGRAPSGDELLFARRFDDGEPESLRRLSRELSRRLPLRRASRRSPQTRGVSVDLRRSLESVVRNDGDIPHPVYSVRQTRPRNLVLLIDVSGSMKGYTDAYLRFAHTLKRSAAGVEVFTLGTRLTRITAALDTSNQRAALASVSALVADWDGGTRLGPAFSAFLATPRFVNFVRGAAVVVLSDALERGDPTELQQSIRRLRRLTWRLSWATPLAADPRFRPETAALKAILPELDDLVNGGDLDSLVNFALALAGRAPSAQAVWSKPRPALRNGPVI